MMTHYYDSNQTSRSVERNITVQLAGRKLSFITDNGLFSKNHLDNATKLLILTANPEENHKVLDLGCGWGGVAISLKTFFPSISMYASDVNKRAVATTRKNALKNNCEITTLVSDQFEKLPSDFNMILTNPPYSAGRTLCFSFIESSYRHLAPGGTFLLVARHSKGGKVLGEKIKEVFGSMDVLSKKGGFRVYCGQK
ncbi:MAG: class I SAM-dependent methyltransferase [Nanobdellota archaeon]